MQSWGVYAVRSYSFWCQVYANNHELFLLKLDTSVKTIENRFDANIIVFAWKGAPIQWIWNNWKQRTLDTFKIADSIYIFSRLSFDFIESQVWNMLIFNVHRLTLITCKPALKLGKLPSHEVGNHLKAKYSVVLFFQSIRSWIPLIYQIQCYALINLIEKCIIIVTTNEIHANWSDAMRNTAIHDYTTFNRMARLNRLVFLKWMTNRMKCKR